MPFLWATRTDAILIPVLLLLHCARCSLRAYLTSFAEIALACLSTYRLKILKRGCRCLLRDARACRYLSARQLLPVTFAFRCVKLNLEY